MPFLHFHKDTVHPQSHVPGGYICQRRCFLLIHSKALYGLAAPLAQSCTSPMFSVVFVPDWGYLSSAIALMSEKLTILSSYLGPENISEMTAQGQSVETSRGGGVEGLERTKLTPPMRMKPLPAHRQFVALLESCMASLLPCSKASACTAFILGLLFPGCAANLHGCKGEGGGGQGGQAPPTAYPGSWSQPLALPLFLMLQTEPKGNPWHVPVSSSTFHSSSRLCVCLSPK